jgi:hypothetical protein
MPRRSQPTVATTVLVRERSAGADEPETRGNGAAAAESAPRVLLEVDEKACGSRLVVERANTIAATVGGQGWQSRGSRT